MRARTCATCLPVITSQFSSSRLRRKPESDIMPLAPFQPGSLTPLMMATHSQTVCTGSGGVAKLRISVMSDFSRSSRASRAASRAGIASSSASSASAFSTPMIWLAFSTSTCFSEASAFLAFALSVANISEEQRLHYYAFWQRVRGASAYTTRCRPASARTRRRPPAPASAAPPPAG